MTIRLSDERQRLLEEAQRIVASGPNDDLPMADGIDAALAHLIESNDTLVQMREDLVLPTYDFDTIVLGLSISNPSRVHC